MPVPTFRVPNASTNQYLPMPLTQIHPAVARPALIRRERRVKADLFARGTLRQGEIEGIVDGLVADHMLPDV